MKKTKNISQAVILAGGTGIRLKPFTNNEHNPMIEIEGKPFLENLIIQIREFEIKNILILLGYMPEVIMDYFGNGEKWGVNINYSVSSVDNDTGGRLLNARVQIENEFLLMYYNNYCPIDFKKAKEQFFESDSLVQITSYSNKDSYTKNNLNIGNNNIIYKYDQKRFSENLNAVDIGYALVNKKVIDLLPDENVNFEKIVYSSLMEKGLLSGYLTEHRYYSIDSLERIELTKEFFKPKKVIFLDRDGTLNVRPPKGHYVEKAEDFIWLYRAKEAVKKLKDKGYILIIITNQAGIAKGIFTEEDLTQIHNKMNKELNEYGTNIDKIYYCPHGWDEGCECRKPKPGMFFIAQKEYSIDLTKSIFIGDDERDMEAGQAAGCKTIFVDKDYKLIDAIIGCDLNI